MHQYAQNNGNKTSCSSKDICVPNESVLPEEQYMFHGGLVSCYSLREYEFIFLLHLSQYFELKVHNLHILFAFVTNQNSHLMT